MMTELKYKKLIAYIVSYGYKIWSLILKEVHKLNELENREVADEGDYLYQSNEEMRKHQGTEHCIVKCFIICTFHRKLLLILN
jgi:hypothetical protein